MRRPNFFILGAPKCGTTSLAAWLSEHPNVYISTIKEPDYFSRDIGQTHRDSLKGYESLFRYAGSDHLAVGEASTSYLRSYCAVPAILEYSPEARFVVCLRNPVEMAISWHGQMCYAGWETEEDFERAWHLRSARREGHSVPRLCPDAGHLDYARVCELGSQLKRLFEIVDRSRVFIIMLDDLRVDPGSVYRDLLSFLGVPDDGRQLFPVLNDARSVPRYVSVLTRLVFDLKRKLGIERGLGLVTRLNTKTGIKGSSQVSLEFRLELQEYFRREICLMESILGRHFTSWLQ